MRLFERKSRVDPVSVRRTRQGRDGKETLILSGLCFLLSSTAVALQTTILGRVPLPGPLAPAAPSLGLLLVLAAGFVLGSEAGGVCGLVTGFLCDAAGDGGVFLLPLVYFLLGYLTGSVRRRVLAGNFPSFLVFAAVGAFLEGGIRVGKAAVSLASLPPLGWVFQVTVPRLLLTMIAAPAVYWIVRLLLRAVRIREE